MCGRFLGREILEFLLQSSRPGGKGLKEKENNSIFGQNFNYRVRHLTNASVDMYNLTTDTPPPETYFIIADREKNTTTHKPSIISPSSETGQDAGGWT
jgi:hypothetical protein